MTKTLNHNVNMSLEDDEKFWNILMELERDIFDYLIGDEGNRDPLWQKYSDMLLPKSKDKTTNKYYEFLDKELGFVGGATSIAHQETNQLHLIQNPLALPKDVIKEISETPYLVIPHIPDAFCEDGYGDFVDYIYIQIRKTQHLKGKTPPEVYKTINPQIKDADADNQVIPPLPLERKLRKQGFRFQYCSVGEICFFLTAWRWIVRLGQAEPDESVSLETFEQIIGGNEYNKRDFWADSFWRKAPKEHAEKQFIDKITDLLSQSEKSRKVPLSPLENNVLKVWNTTPRTDIDAELPPDTGFFADMKYVGLIDDQGIITESFRSLMRFTYHVFLRSSRFRQLKENEDFRKEIKDFLQAVEDSFSGTPPIPLAQRDLKYLGFESIIGKIWMAILLDEGEKADTITLLARLQSLARFQMLPMFYWIALHADRRPLEHVIMPIGESFYSPVEYATPTGSGGNGDEQRYKKTPSVALGLFAIRPSWDMPGYGGRDEGNEEYLERSRISPITLMRLMRINEFFIRAVRPAFDKTYHAGIEKERTQVSASTQRAIVSGHEAGAQLQSIERLYPFVGEINNIEKLVRGSVTYANLFLSLKSDNNSSMEKYIRTNCNSAHEWLDACLETAWQITLAREARAVSEKDDARLVSELFERIPQAKVILIPDRQRPIRNGLGKKHPHFEWDLSRWVMAALSNTLKWSMPGTGRLSGMDLIRQWHDNSENKPIVILLKKDAEAGLTKITFYNGATASSNVKRALKSEDKISNGGSRAVLLSIADSLPYVKDLTFDRVDGDEKRIIEGEEIVFKTELILETPLFS